MAKPKISLKIGSAFAHSPSPATHTTATTTATPASSIKIKFTSLSKPSPGDAVPDAQGRSTKVSKAERQTKRDRDDNEPNTAGSSARPAKKIKFNLGAQTPKTPTLIKAKFKGKPPKRPLGDGYDSEASDREEDPAIEEQCILRMMEGEDCEYLRQMIDQRRIGVPRSQGGADVQLRFLSGDGRRVAITIRGRHYAATMVHLPTIIEGMKSWDRKGWYKTADICQMLLVFAAVKEVREASTIELPSIIDRNTQQYPHGLTPPMYYARRRRFRKRISRDAIEAVEDAVEKLLAADDAAESSRYELIEPDERQAGSAPYHDPYADDDAEGELDDAIHFDQSNVGQTPSAAGHDEDLEADLEAAFENDLLAATPNVAGETPYADSIIASTPAAGAAESSGDDDDDDDDEGGAEDDIDNEQRVRNAELQGAREDIAEMEKQLANLQAQLATQSNPILKRRIKDNMAKVEEELQLKKSAIGEGMEE
jgi:transcription initiation factor TFIID subunit 7